MLREIQIRIQQVRSLIAMRAVRFDFEALLERHYRRLIRPGDTVLDIGAHTGRHLEPFVELVGSRGRVVAFEPLPFAHELLCRRFVDKPVTIHQVALGERDGTSEFTFARGAPEESGLKARVFNRPSTADPTTISVEVRRLDGLAGHLSTIRFIKIDIEGGEIGCLRGATTTLSRTRPMLSVGYGHPSYSVYGHEKATLFELAAANDYVLYDIFLNRLGEIEEWNLACDSVYWDFFMVPPEREAEFVAALRD